MAGKGCAILALRLFRRLWRFKAVEALSGKGFRGGSAFGRLRVETAMLAGEGALVAGPPLGGCVLKLLGIGGCCRFCRPPLGGCVLKHSNLRANLWKPSRAAFGRLRVETLPNPIRSRHFANPPLGGCVLKHCLRAQCGRSGSAAFGRLRVETPSRLFSGRQMFSRLWAAAC